MCNTLLRQLICHLFKGADFTNEQQRKALPWTQNGKEGKLTAAPCSWRRRQSVRLTRVRPAWPTLGTQTSAPTGSPKGWNQAGFRMAMSPPRVLSIPGRA